MTITLYGITNCDTVKRARAWLAGHDIAYTFHDFKRAGVPAERLQTWMAALGWEKLVNRQGTTWRKLDDAVKAAVTGEEAARRLMNEQPSVIKRPVMEWPDGSVTAGFDEADWARRIG